MMSNPGMKMQPPKSIPDQIYEYVMERIHHGEIQEGERLIEVKIAQTLQTSRTPVREAFRLLEQDGVVERLPQGGVRVTSVSAETAREIFGIRCVLESYAMGLACRQITHDHLDELKVMRNKAFELIQSKNMSKDGKRRRLFELNTRFHDTVYQATNSQYLLKLINNLRFMVLRLRAAGLREESGWRKAWEDHDLLIQYLENRDPEKATALVRVHIEKAARDAAASASDSPGKVNEA
jgi:DNA-binding GntR family transcriptional regulator